MASNKSMKEWKRRRIHTTQQVVIEWCWQVGKQNGTLMHHSIVEGSLSMLNFCFVKVKLSPTSLIILKEPHTRIKIIFLVPMFSSLCCEKKDVSGTQLKYFCLQMRIWSVSYLSLLIPSIEIQISSLHARYYHCFF